MSYFCSFMHLRSSSFPKFMSHRQQTWGPLCTLYIPGPLLRPGKNYIVSFLKIPMEIESRGNAVSGSVSFSLLNYAAPFTRLLSTIAG